MAKPYSERIRRTHCVHCGKELTTKQKGNRQQYCGKDCYREHKNVGELVDCVCENCGKVFRARRDRTTYCSRECAFEDQPTEKACASCGKAYRRGYSRDYCSERCLERGRPLQCIWCGDSYYGRVEGYCSDECRKAKARQDYYDNFVSVQETNEPVALVCPECGKVFECNYHAARRVYCSDKCANRKQGRNANHRRRARQYGNGESDSIDSIAVFKRAKWRCEWCGVSTPKSFRGTIKDRAPELDHIVALANGGTHTWDNVQCLCRKCNGEKGASDAGQLRLRIPLVG